MEYQIQQNGKVIGTYESSEAAMVAFASVGFNGKITPVDATVGPQIASDGPRSIETAAVEQDAQRVAVANAIGLDVFAKAPTWFAHGTPLIAVGKDKYRASAQAWEALPLIEEAAHEVGEVITKERRKDVDCDASELRLDDRGRITRNGKDWVAIESNAFDQLIQRYPVLFPRGRALLHAVDPGIRAEVVNSQLVKLRNEPESTRGIKLRLRRGRDGAPQMYSATSTGYSVHDGDAWLGDVAEVLGGQEWRGSAVYDADAVNTSFVAQYHAPVDFDAKVGDVHRVTIGGRTNDTGSGSFRSWGGATRTICWNLARIDLEGAIARHVHRGSVDNLRVQLRDTVAALNAGFAYFGQQWGILGATSIGVALTDMGLTSDTSIATPESWLSDLASHTALVDTEIARDVMLEVLLRGFKQEPGEDAQALINAVTRTHTDAALDMYQVERLQIAAGILVNEIAGAA